MPATPPLPPEIHKAVTKDRLVGEPIPEDELSAALAPEGTTERGTQGLSPWLVVAAVVGFVVVFLLVLRW